jgi:hypothetical protein
LKYYVEILKYVVELFLETQINADLRPWRVEYKNSGPSGECVVGKTPGYYLFLYRAKSFALVSPL